MEEEVSRSGTVVGRSGAVVEEEVRLAVEEALVRKRR